MGSYLRNLCLSFLVMVAAGFAIALAFIFLKIDLYSQEGFIAAGAFGFIVLMLLQQLLNKE